MRKLIRKILIIFLPIALLLVLLYLMPYFLTLNNSSNNYLAANIDKQRLLKNTPSPKIVFIGGSNLAFGLNSEEVEKKLGRPVVNMGLHASLSLSFMLNEIKTSIKQGDIIIIVPEYSHFYKSPRYDDPTIAGLLYVNPTAGRYLTPIIKYKSILSNIPILIKLRKNDFIYSLIKDQERIRTGGQKILYRGAFNEKGDLISHLDQKQPIDKLPLPSASSKKIVPETILFLNDFTSFVADKGAQIFLIFPPRPDSYYRIEEPQIMCLYQELKKKLNIELLGTPLDYVFPDNLFFNTDYHLNRKGREIRTAKIITALKKVIADK